MLATSLLVSCKEAIGPLAALAADAAVAVAAESIRAAMESGDHQSDPTMPDDTGQRRLVTHPLVNLVATKNDGVIGPRTFASEMHKRDVVWFSLRYDNADHWRTTARLVAALAELGSKPKLLFDAIPDDEQNKLTGQDPRALPDLLPWPRYGIETPAMLGPLFAVVQQKQLLLGGAGTSPTQLRAFAQRGAEAANTEQGKLLGLDVAWPAARRAALVDALAAQRCGALPSEAVGALTVVDRAKSAGLARNVLAATPEAGPTPRVIVITEAHRGRVDLGAPRALTELATREGRTITEYSVGFLELDAERTQIEEYDPEVARYDATWLTPTLHEPCPATGPLAP